ncbi:MAG: type 2 isopentenyl-diphosphate Delta-isomerase [Bradymonadales bacterium]|nr:type 2 isopentenyl-diphosphate Delta-isomerase [Bradymonadales bacterium]
MTTEKDPKTTASAGLTERRKRDHLDLFRLSSVEAKEGSTWLEHVHLVHQALPELDWDGIDLTAHFAGRTFQAPLFITGMTGGTDEAGEINRSLAALAQHLGIGFGVGSQRAMLQDPALLDSYRVREVAPDVFLAGNIGAAQIRDLSADQVRWLVEEIGADALCVHLNPAQEIMQPEGDRSFSGILQRLARLVAEIPVPIIVKETGCGISREAGLALKAAGVKAVDVAGSGGTSWTGVEILRRRDGIDTQPETFWDWGIPTAATLLELHGQGLELMASGGIRNGLDAARAIALGAEVVGMASPVLQAYFAGGIDGARRFLERVIHELRIACLLTASAALPALQKAPHVLTGELLAWQEQRSEPDPRRRGR